MRQWLMSVLKTALAQKLPLLLASLSPVLAGVLIYLRTEIAPHLSDPTGWLALQSIAVAAALLPLPFFAYFWFRPKLKPLLWGVHQDTKSGVFFCSACLIPHKVHSPMYLSRDGRFWICHSNSNHRKQNPDNKEPPAPPQPSGPHAWMAR